MPSTARRYLYVEMDSMDQMKCSLPHFHQPSKDFDHKHAVPNIVTCVRVPGECCLEFVGTNNFAHDANYTVTVLHR